MKPTKDQERAKYAWLKAGGNRDEKYRNLAKAAPAMVMSSGLMQTLAFLKEKGKGHHEKLLEHILGWLSQDGILREKAEFSGAMEALYKSDPAKYRRATEEALAVLRWIRQLAGSGQG